MTSSPSEPLPPDSSISQGGGTLPQDDAILQPVSRRSAAIWNTIFSYVAMVLVIARNLALVPLYLQYIGKEEYNAWLVTGAVLMQLTSVDFGLMGVLLQQTAAAYGSRHRDQLQKLIGTGLVLAAFVSLVVGGIAAAVSPILPSLIDVRPDVGRRLTTCFLIVAFANAVQLLGFAFGGLLRSLQRTVFPGLFVVLSELASLGATLYLVITGWGMYAIVIGLVIRAVVEVSGTSGTFFWIIVRHLKLRPRWDWQQVRRLWRYSIYQFLTQVAGRIKTTIDSFFIGVFLGKEVGGSYALTTRAHDTVRMFSQAFGGSVGSPLAHLHGEGNITRFKEVIFSLFKVTVLTGVIGYGCVIAFNQTFMLLWVGPHIYSCALINVLAAFSGIAYSLLMVPYEALFTRAGFSAIARVVWIEVIVRIAVMIWLLRTIGVMGAPLSSLLCQIFLILIPLTWINAKALHFTRAELGSSIGSMLKLLAGPLILAAAFGLTLRNAPVLCTYLVSPAASDGIAQSLSERFPPEMGAAISHTQGAPRIYASAPPALQETIGASLSGVSKSTPSPANAWIVLVAEACLYLVLCLIYTWIVDRRLVLFMLRGGRGAAV